MNKPLPFFTCTLLLIATTASSLSAQSSVVLTPSKDNTMYEEGPANVSNGAGQYLFAGNSGSGSSRRALVAFDVAGAIGDGAAVIDSVQLTLTMSRTISDAATMTLHRVTGDWGEGASVGVGNEGGGGAAEDHDATWNFAFVDSLMWNTSGGDFLPDPSGVIEIDSLGTYTLSSSAGLVADIEHWLAHPDENFGWILIGDEAGAATAKRFNSRQNADTTTVPMLEIFYSTPTANEREEQPASIAEISNYPNPFRSQTTFTFTLARPSETSLVVYDVLGREVKVLLNRSIAAGQHDVLFDASALTPGVYFYLLSTSTHQVAKALLIQ